jgi:hypothetical protein
MQIRRTLFGTKRQQFSYIHERSFSFN